MKKTVNTSHVRSINQRAVLDAIFHQTSISRAELARMLNMSKPSMADNVADLLEIGIIEELGEGTVGKGGGRKPILLRFCDNFKYIIAMDFHYRHTCFALSNLKGDILNEFTIYQTPMADFSAWIQMCLNAVSTLISAQGIASKDLAVIAVSTPGILDLNSNSYIVSSKYGEFNAAFLADRLKETFDVPVIIKNSTNASALGEFHYGAGQDYQDILYVSCGQGVGAGLILKEKLFEGRHMAAGEFGFFITPDTLSNPQNMRLEDRISIESILEILNEDRPEEDRPITFPDMITLWKNHNSDVTHCVDRICVELGCAISCLQSAFDCQIIILGGEYLAFAEQLIPAINNIVKEHCPVPAPVVASTLGDKNTVLGMIATSREYYFKQICSR